MLHSIPESTQRARLLEVVEMQRKLIEGLCALPANGKVSNAWLRRIWPGTPANWVRRFWENENGDRAKWCRTIAKATTAEKATIRAMFAEQIRFPELYTTPPTVRLTKHDWKQEPMKSVRELLTAFYHPYFGPDEGFSNSDGSNFHRREFIQSFQPPVKICPYTDNCFQDTKLDHFLPKDHFPALSCHPDNLIPCSTDSNSIEHKGNRVPLDFDELEQTAKWFHPRWRMASEKFRLSFGNDAGKQRIRFHAFAVDDQPRLDNMDAMFGLNEFWSKHLNPDLQDLARSVSDELCEYRIEPTQQLVKQKVEKEADKRKDRMKQDALSIVYFHYYAYIAVTPALLNEVLQTCMRDFALKHPAPVAAE